MRQTHKVGACLKAFDARIPKMIKKTVSGMAVFEYLRFKTIFDEFSAKYVETLKMKINQESLSWFERSCHEGSEKNDEAFYW